jgi:uncharacterized protein (TIGR00288 family)
MGETNETRNLAVFIDYENFAKQESFDVNQLITRLMERGRLLIKRAYADWGRFASVKREMLRVSVDLIELPSHSSSKNRADIRLVVDAMETAMTREYIDTIVVVSGDSDFLPLISKLRELNRYVIVVAHKQSLSSLVAGYCDELIYYSALVGREKVTDEDMKHAEVLLLRALRKLDDDGIEPRMSLIKSCMRQLDASFSEENVGFTQFKSFLKHFVRKKTIRLVPLDHGDCRVEAFDATVGPEISAANNAVVEAMSTSSDSLPDSLLDRICWAARLVGADNCEPCTLSIIGGRLKLLFPQLSLRQYGFPAQGSLLKLAQTMEQEDWCRLSHDAKTNQFAIQFSPKFFAREMREPQPENFDEYELSRRARLQEIHYSHDLTNRLIELTQQVIEERARMSAYMTADEIYPVCDQLLEEGLKRMNDRNRRLHFDSLLELGAFKDQNGESIRASDQAVYRCESFQTVCDTLQSRLNGEAAQSISIPDSAVAEL